MLQHLSKTQKQGIRMVDTLDVRDLSDEQVKILERLAKLFRKHKKAKKEQTKVVFNTWPLGVKGKLTRKEIYEHI